MAMEDKPALIRPSWKQLIVRQWKPQPLSLPAVNPNLGHSPTLQRVSLVLRYSVLQLEYWISPGGTLREWLRFNVAVALFIGIPALVVVPIVTFLLWQFATWTEYLVQLAKNFLLFPLLMLGSCVVVTAFLCFLRGLLRK
jgi:hypothetical protein